MSRELPPLQGHREAAAAFATAVARQDAPSTLLVHGAPGIGKQRFALWIGQLLLCAQPAATGPCGTCQPCRLALRLEHPDLHWFFPLVRPKSSGSSDRLMEALEESRHAEIENRRAHPLRASTPGEPTGIYVGQVQTIRRSANSRPAMGTRKVFVIGEAEKLVPQEASQEAANALLKVLEEPPSDTTFILTASDPEALLPTIRSRLQPLRLVPLPEPDVAAFLTEHADVPEDDAVRLARIAQGSIGRALSLMPVGKHAGPLEEVRQSARDFLEAAIARDESARLAAAHALSPAGARGAFSDTLEQLALWVRDLAAVAAGAQDLVINVDANEWLDRAARACPGASRNAPIALAAVENAMDLAQGNVNPQLVAARLLRELRVALRG